MGRASAALVYSPQALPLQRRSMDRRSLHTRRRLEASLLTMLPRCDWTLTRRQASSRWQSGLRSSQAGALVTGLMHVF